jgi:hypothetical protein
MPWLPLYIDADDLTQLVAWLNNEEVIAFIVPDGPKRWRAVRELDGLPADGRIALWHAASGPLPLVRSMVLHTLLVPDGKIRDPFRGWREQRTGADPTCPYFGAGHPGVYWFDVHTRSRHRGDGMGLSAFEWIGDRYKCIGHGASAVTRQWWNRLGRYIRRQAVRIPRKGAVDGPGPEIWAMPSALGRILEGCARSEW